MPAFNNIGDLGDRLKQLQSQVDNFYKMQQKLETDVQQITTSPSATQLQNDSQNNPQQPSGPTYPRVWRSDTVEDILNNPQWKQELGEEFAGSESGLKAKNFTEVLFLEFCEKQTGKSSTKLSEVRKSQQATPPPEKKPKASTVPKAAEEPRKEE
jgi:hypothetical protein